MKILQVNCVYDYGSTGKLTRNLHEGLLSQEIISCVLYGRRQKIHEKNIYKTCTEFEAKSWNMISRLTGSIYSAAPVGTAKLINYLQCEKPDIVHLQCLNGFFVNIYSLLNYLKKEKIHTILTLHAEFMFTGGCSHAMECMQWADAEGCGKKKCPYYHSDMKSIFLDRSGYMWKKMKKAFEGFEENLTVVSVSPWLMERAKKSTILKDKKHQVILNGVDTEIFKYLPTSDFREKYECIGKKVVFHATAAFSTKSDHIKGGYYVLELAKRMPEVLFLVAGQCVEKIDTPTNLIFLGKISDQRLLAQYYSMADLTLLTSKRETFSMICAESLCCGTPVAGFKAGGPESIALPEYSDFFEFGNIDELQDFINKNRTGNSKVKIAEKAQKVYSVDTMINKYIELYKRSCADGD